MSEKVRDPAYCIATHYRFNTYNFYYNLCLDNDVSNPNVCPEVADKMLRDALLTE